MNSEKIKGGNMPEESEKTLDVAEPVMSDNEVLDTQGKEEISTKNEEVDFDETEVKETNESQEDTLSIVEEKSAKKIQSPEENSKYAAKRREKENLQFKIDEAYKKGQLDAYKGKINPYTQTEIKDVHDIRVYENMYKLDKEGKNPIEDYASYIADKEREEELNRIKQEELQETARKDIEEFQVEYPDVDLQKLLDDEIFKDYLEGKNKPLKEIYSSYLKMQNQFRNDAINVAKQTIANSNASPGSLSSGAEIKVNYENMSSEEFNKYAQRVIDGDIR